MRVLKWVAGSLAALALLLIVAVIVLTTMIDANRFKGRIERMAEAATGQPLRIVGDLDIAWYPWLALKMGEARLGSEPAVARWQSASVGARLIPLIKGRLEVSRVRFDGLYAQLIRGPDGHGNWEPLLLARSRSPSEKTPPQVAGLEIRNGTIEYIDAKRPSTILLANWKLDTGPWQPGKPLSMETSFELQGVISSARAVPAVTHASGMLESTKPLRARGEVSIQTSSLRQLLDQLAIAGPRPRDAQALRALKVEARWTWADGSFAMKPIEARLDDTTFHGKILRPKGAGAMLHFELVGDRIALDRYLHIEDTSTEPFELPTAELKAMRVTGVLSFVEARMGNATIRNARIRLETEDGPPT